MNMLTNLKKNERITALLLCMALLLSACAPTEAEVASNELPPTVNADDITVEALLPIPSPSATPPNTPTAIATDTATAQPTATSEPTNTATPVVELRVVEADTPTAVVERISADSTPTLEPIDSTQLFITPTITIAMPSPEPREPVTVPSHLQPIADQIIEDIIGRTGIDRNAISLLSYEAVTWPDGAIGCPQPGMAYTQALVDGYRLLFDASGKQMFYHTAGTQRFVFCDTAKVKPDKPVPGSSVDR